MSKNSADTANSAADWAVVVDDSPTSLSVLCGLLNKLGFTTISYRDGQHALDGLKELPPELKPKIRIIFSDVYMPGMNGLELLRAIRGNQEFAHLPLVIVSVSNEKVHIEEAASLKISGYLLKPITSAAITELITGLFPDRAPNKLLVNKTKIRRSG